MHELNLCNVCGTLSNTNPMSTNVLSVVSLSEIVMIQSLTHVKAELRYKLTRSTLYKSCPLSSNLLWCIILHVNIPMFIGILYHRPIIIDQPYIISTSLIMTLRYCITSRRLCSPWNIGRNTRKQKLIS